MINPKILKPKVMNELIEGFAENNPQGIQVQGFLEPECYTQLLSDISSADFKKNEQRDSHSYFEARPGALAFFTSKEFLSFVKAVTGKKVTKATCSLTLFMHGSYTLLHDEVARDKIEFSFDLTPEWNDQSGGATTFLTEEGEKLVLPPAPNTLILAASGRSYVKYVNHLAKEDGRLIVRGILE